MFILNVPHLSDEGTELWLKCEPVCLLLAAAGEATPLWAESGV